MSAEEPLTRAETLRRRLDALESEKREVLAELAELDQAETRPAADPQPTRASASESVTASSDSAAKIELFRSLCRGREDVFPRRWENKKTGKSGYAPVCRNEWIRGIFADRFLFVLRASR